MTGVQTCALPICGGLAQLEDLRLHGLQPVRLLLQPLDLLRVLRRQLLRLEVVLAEHAELLAQLLARLGLLVKLGEVLEVRVDVQLRGGDGFAFAELYAAVTRDVECCPSKTACSRRASGLMGPRDAPSLSPPTASNWAAALEPSDDDAAAKEARSAHVDALCACLESGLLETARGGARALAALAARDASLFADKPEVWMRVASIAGDNHADDDVRIAALSVVAHLAEARFGAGASGAAVAQAEADAFGRLIEPLLDTIEHASCEHVRGEAARALAPLSSAFPSTFAHLGARDVLTSAIRSAPEHAVVRQFAALALVHVR